MNLWAEDIVSKPYTNPEEVEMNKTLEIVLPALVVFLMFLPLVALV